MGERAPSLDIACTGWHSPLTASSASALPSSTTRQTAQYLPLQPSNPPSHPILHSTPTTRFLPGGRQATTLQQSQTTSATQPSPTITPMTDSSGCVTTTFLRYLTTFPMQASEEMHVAILTKNFQPFPKLYYPHMLAFGFRSWVLSIRRLQRPAINAGLLCKFGLP